MPYAERHQADSLRVKVDSVIHRYEDPMKISMQSSNAATPRNFDDPDTPNINSFKYTFAPDHEDETSKFLVQKAEQVSDDKRQTPNSSGLFRAVSIDDLKTEKKQMPIVKVIDYEKMENTRNQ